MATKVKLLMPFPFDDREQFFVMSDNSKMIVISWAFHQRYGTYIHTILKADGTKIDLNKTVKENNVEEGDILYIR